MRFSDILSRPYKKKPGGGGDPSAKKEGKQGLQLSDVHKNNVDGKSVFSGGADFSEESGSVKPFYDQLLEEAKNIRDRVRSNQKISSSVCLSIIHQIVQQDLVGELYEYAVSVLQHDDLPSHSIAVTSGSLKVGSGLNYDTENMLKLGLAAFIENVGMYRIPEGILNKKEKLNPDDIATIRKHPEISAQIVREMGETFEWLAEICLQIHERSDGSGYLRGLKGDEISEFASIIGLIDTYVAMTKDRPYRHKFVQTEAVKSILEIDKTKFPSRVIKEFLNQISLFPVNTYVKLNNKSIGRVISTDRSQPLRPKIQVLYNGLGQKLEQGEIVDLSGSPLLHVVEALDEKDLA